MSYCRCNGDDSNVYVFGNGTTWEIYVQSNEKFKEGDPLDDECWRPFPHARAGQHFDCADRQECLDKLQMLRDEGLKVPFRAIKRLQAEMAESKPPPQP